MVAGSRISPSRIRSIKIAVICIASVITLDQLSKFWAWSRDGAASGEEINSWLNFVLVYNSGVSFGLLGGETVPPWVFAIISLGAAAILAVMIYREESRVMALGLGAITGGALGNMIDRIAHGAVVDFIDVHWLDWHWPAFNIADSAITLGVIVLLIQYLKPAGTVNRADRSANEYPIVTIAISPRSIESRVVLHARITISYTIRIAIIATLLRFPARARSD